VHAASDETRWVSGSEASPPSWTYAGINLATVDYAGINLATQDLHGTFEQLQAGDAEVVQEPTDQTYGIQDGAFRDPAGEVIRIQELR
jgi:hypothetical protein